MPTTVHHTTRKHILRQPWLGIVCVHTQIALTGDAQKRILGHVKEIHQLRAALDHIEIVMGFLAASSQLNPKGSLADYAINTLRIEAFDRKVKSHPTMLILKMLKLNSMYVPLTDWQGVYFGPHTFAVGDRLSRTGQATNRHGSGEDSSSWTHSIV